MKFVLVFAFWGGPAPARPPEDPWFGRDKALHFVASAAIQGATHAVLRARGLDYGPASRSAAAVTLSIGVGKEWWDKRRGGDPSVRDIAWDAAGVTAAAVGVRQVDRRP